MTATSSSSSSSTSSTSSPADRLSTTSTTSTDKDAVYFYSADDVRAAAAASSTSTQADANMTDDSPSAVDPTTGEINWDCPCLGGMARGPCGDQFKASFSCFVYSEAEPKGADCVQAFRAMQDCFQTFPEYYADQLGETSKGDAEQRLRADDHGEGEKQEEAQASTTETRTTATI